MIKSHIERLKALIQSTIPQELLSDFLQSQNVFYEQNLANRRRTTNNKYKRLMEQSIINNAATTPSLNSKALLNVSNTTLPSEVEMLLSLGSKFALPHKSYTEAPLFHFIAETEHILKNKDGELQERTRCKIANSIQNYINRGKNKTLINSEQRFYNEIEQKTKSFLKQHPDLLVLKADKGNKTVILPKDTYADKMLNMLEDAQTYQKVQRDPTPGFQSKTNDMVKRLQALKLIDDKTAAKLRTYTATCPKIYGQPKAHKENLPMRPVVPCMTSPTFELSKYIGTIIKKSLISKYNVADSFQFCEYINNVKLPADHIMVSFDVVALFTSIPKSLVISSIIRRWENIKTNTHICLDLFCELVTHCIDCSYFSFNGQYYVQKFGTAMGNPLSPIIADLVTEDLLDNALTSINFPVPHIKKYVDDLFLSLPENQITNTLIEFNKQNNHIQFTCEKEKNNRLPFLDMTLVRMEDQKIKTEWYMKPIASGRFLNYHSSHPMHQKVNIAFNFAKRVKALSTNLNEHETNNIIRTQLQINSYPKSLINRIINRTRTQQNQNINNNTTQQREPTTNTAMDVRENENTKSFRSLTNIFGLTQQVTKILKKEYPNIIIATKNTKTVGSLLPPVSAKTPILDQCNVVYELQCESGCQAKYIGMTSTKLKQRISAHKSNIKQLQTFRQQGLTNTTAEISWIINKTALINHIANTGHSFDLDAVKIKARSNKKEYLPIIESCYIKNTPNCINKRTDTDNLHAVYAGILNEIKTSRQ